MSGWGLCVHTDVYFYVYIYRSIINVLMFTCLYVPTDITPNLAVLSFEASMQQPIFILISGFILMFDLEKAQYLISALHKYFNRSQRVRPIPWKMKWQRFYNS